MIIYGWKSVAGKSERAPGLICPSCNRDQMVITTIHRYFYVYWIPLFPLKRGRFAVCDHCKKTVEGKELKELASRAGGESILPPIEGLRPQYFALLILFFGLGAFGAFNESRQKQPRRNIPAVQIEPAVPSRQPVEKE